MELTQYFNRLNQAISRRNGRALCNELALNPRRFSNDTIRQIHRPTLDSFCANGLPDFPAFGAIVASCMKALLNAIEGRYDQAFEEQHIAYNKLLDVYAEKDDNMNWLVTVIGKVSNDLRLLAEQADKIAKNDNKNLRDSLTSFTRGFTIAAQDRTPITQPHAKKLAIFTVSNILFKAYFKLNTLQLCSKLINVVEGPAGIMDNLRLFSVSDVVIYKYYIGRLKMFEDRYEEARECLRFALKYCPVEYILNRQKILANLVPVEICLGIMPREILATKYNLTELFELGLAVRRGDIQTYEAIMQTRQRSFIRLGVFLVLEQAKNIAYRNLFKRISITLAPRINLLDVERVFNWLGKDCDLDEIECILSNLIYRNQVRGYISHQKRFLIVSKVDPFPIANVMKKPM